MRVAISDNSNGSRILAKNIKHLSESGHNDDYFNIESLEIIGEQAGSSIYHAYISYLNNEIDTIIIHSLQRRKEIMAKVQELADIGFEKSDIYVASIELMKGDWDKINAISPFISIDKLHYMDTLLIPITEHCNLNCKGCSHFSPLVQEEKFLDYGSFCRDLVQLKKKITHTDRINFLGGEPLLHKDLYQFLLFARKIYPYARMNIVTNGILLRQIPKELLQAVKETGTMILLSAYPAMTKQIAELEDWMNDNRIPYHILPMSGFAPMLEKDRKPFPNESTEIICSNCNMLQYGILVRCPMFLTVEYFNESFGANYPYKDGWINIYDENMSSEEIFFKLNKPHELCHYCARFKMPSAGIKPWSNYGTKEAKKADDWF